MLEDSIRELTHRLFRLKLPALDGNRFVKEVAMDCVWFPPNP